MRGFRFFAILALVLTQVLTQAEAHDIPADVTVQAFLKPADGRLQLLVRVPLGAMRDMMVPELPGGYLDVEKAMPLLPDAATLWISDFVELYEGDRRLPKPRIVSTQLSFASDRSFESFETAAAHVKGPRLPNSANVVWSQALLDILFEYPIRSDRSAFSIHSGLGRLATQVVTVLRFVTPEGAVRAFEFAGDPGLLPLDPSWHQAALRFIKMGFLHILDGTDHLLFLLCLVIPFRRFRSLVLVVTAFTTAHSLTLIASAYNLAPQSLWFPPLIETMIAASIVYMALENIAGGSTGHRRWIIAFGFGLVHGFGFSFALRETLQFAGSHLLTSLLCFNIGVELGQVLALLLFIPLLDLLFRFVVEERMGVIIVSALVAHTGWQWMTDRWQQLRRFTFEWPEWNAAFLAVGLQWMAIALAAGGAVAAAAWAIRQRFGRNTAL